MAAGTVTTTTAANWIPEIWASELSDAATANTVLSELVDRQYESDMSVGDTIRINDRHNPAVRLKTGGLGSPATFDAVTETQQSLVIDKHAYVGFLVEDIAELQSKYEVRSEYTSASAYSLKAFLEGDTTSGLVSLGSGFSQSAGTLGVDPTYDNLVSAVRSLDLADAPESDRYFWVSPGTYAAMLKMTEFTSSDFVGGRAVETAKVGRVLNTTVYKSTLSFGFPAGGQSKNWFNHKRGVALILQRAPQTHVSYILESIAWGVIMDEIYNFVERLIEPKDLGGGGTANDQFNFAVNGA